MKVALEIEEARQRKAIEEEQRRLDDQRIEALQTARRNAEISKEQEEKRLKREKEKEMARYYLHQFSYNQLQSGNFVANPQ